MEGGIFSWRAQDLINSSPSLDSYGKPLPNPPHGWYWQQSEDNTWNLIKFTHDLTGIDSKMVAFTRPSVIDHVVMPEDNLSGICLRYHVSSTTLRQSNLFSGNNIQALKTLRIPIEPGCAIDIQSETEDILIQKFKNISGEGKIESKVYLEENNWNIEKALISWKTDETWNHTHHITTDDKIIQLQFSQTDSNSLHDYNIVQAAAVEMIKEVKPIAIKFDKPAVYELRTFHNDDSMEPLLR